MRAILARPLWAFSSAAAAMQWGPGNAKAARSCAPKQKPRTPLLLIWLVVFFPFTAPSIAGGGGGKARMSERRDARVRAGPLTPRSAGHHARAARVVRCRGRRLFGYFFFAGEEKVTRAPDARGKAKGRVLNESKSGILCSRE